MWAASCKTWAGLMDTERAIAVAMEALTEQPQVQAVARSIAGGDIDVAIHILLQLLYGCNASFLALKVWQEDPGAPGCRIYLTGLDPAKYAWACLAAYWRPGRGQDLLGPVYAFCGLEAGLPYVRRLLAEDAAKLGAKFGSGGGNGGNNTSAASTTGASETSSTGVRYDPATSTWRVVGSVVGAGPGAGAGPGPGPGTGPRTATKPSLPKPNSFFKPDESSAIRAAHTALVSMCDSADHLLSPLDTDGNAVATTIVLDHALRKYHEQVRLDTQLRAMGSLATLLLGGSGGPAGVPGPAGIPGPAGPILRDLLTARCPDKLSPDQRALVASLFDAACAISDGRSPADILAVFRAKVGAHKALGPPAVLALRAAGFAV